MSKVKIHIIRHAQSEFNAGIPGAQNKPNCPLSTLGQKQATKLQGNFDLVICSPLQRAQETFFHSSIKTKDLLVSHICREIYDGNIINLFPEEIGKVEVETAEQTAQRIENLRELVHLLSKQYNKICIISHFCFLQKITRRNWIDNAEMFEFEI